MILSLSPSGYIIENFIIAIRYSLSEQTLTLNEEQLVKELAESREGAFRRMVNRYTDKVFNLCLNFVPNKEDAEDLTQDVFFEVYNSIGSFRKDSSLSTWIHKIAVNKSLEHIRRGKRKKRFAFIVDIAHYFKGGANVETPVFNHPGVEAENRQRAEILYRAIDALSENQRVALTLSEMEGLSYKEISSIMDTSLSSVESLIFRAKQNLRKKLSAYYKERAI